MSYSIFINMENDLHLLNQLFSILERKHNIGLFKHYHKFLYNPINFVKEYGFEISKKTYKKGIYSENGLIVLEKDIHELLIKEGDSYKPFTGYYSEIEGTVLPKGDFPKLIEQIKTGNIYKQVNKRQVKVTYSGEILPYPSFSVFLYELLTTFLRLYLHETLHWTEVKGPCLVDFDHFFSFVLEHIGIGVKTDDDDLLFYRLYKDHDLIEMITTVVEGVLERMRHEIHRACKFDALWQMWEITHDRVYGVRNLCIQSFNDYRVVKYMESLQNERIQQS